MTRVVSPPTLTLEEFLKQPEIKPASEFTDGRVEQKSMPQGKHSRLQLRFCDRINEIAEAAQIAMAFPELRCSFGGRSIVSDATGVILVFRPEQLPTELVSDEVLPVLPDLTLPLTVNEVFDWLKGKQLAR